MLKDTYGFALGYLPVRDSSLATRRTNSSNKALQISQDFKIYMACIDGLQTSLTKGDYFSTVAYRTYFGIDDARTDTYIIETNDSFYLYADWHETTAADRISLPARMAGLTYSLVEKSDNVSILSQATGSIVFSADMTSDTYGYAILKFLK